MLVTIALFAAGIFLGIAGALVWAWGVRSGQFRDMEKTKEPLFWPELASGEPGGEGGGAPPAGTGSRGGVDDRSR